MIMEFTLAPDIQKKLTVILKKIEMAHIKPDQLVAFRSYGSKSRAIARIWALPRIWQLALNLKPHYCIEVVSHRFDKLSESQQIRVLIHELMHIPKNFSGALLPHRTRFKSGINSRNIEKFFKEFMKNL